MIYVHFSRGWVCLHCGRTHFHCAYSSLKQPMCLSKVSSEAVLALKGQEIAKQTHTRVADMNSVTQ